MRSLIGRGPADDLRSFEAVQDGRDRDIQKEIQINIEKHISWNKGYVDKTRAPLTPVSEKNIADRSTEYRKAVPMQILLPTPPASVSDGESDNIEMVDGEAVTNKSRLTKSPMEPSIRYCSPDPNAPPAPSFRTRVGRGGRLVMDRRLPFRPMEHHPFQKLERNNFDSDEEDIEHLESDDDQDHDFDRCMVQRQFLYGKAQNPPNALRQIENASGLHRSPSQVTSAQQPTTASANA